MDCRPLDRMGADDQAILDAPFRPFYDIFGIKPVIVNQCVPISQDQSINPCSCR